MERIAELERELGSRERSVSDLKKQLQLTMDQDHLARQLSSVEQEMGAYVSENKKLITENKDLKQRLSKRMSSAQPAAELELSLANARNENAEVQKRLRECEKQLELFKEEYKHLSEKASEEKERLLA